VNRISTLTASVMAIGLIAGSSIVSAHEVDDKNRISENYDLSGFDNLEIGGVFELDVIVGDSFSVEASGSEDEMENIKVFVEGDTLRIENKKKRWRNNKNRHGVDIKISMPSLSAIAIGGVGEVDITGISGGDLDVEVGGVGEITINGNCKNLDIDIAGVGEMNAKALECEHADIDLAGVGEINVYASQSVDVSAMGVGEVNVYGNPEQVDKNKSFLSQVNIK